MGTEVKVTPGLGYSQELVTRLVGWFTIGATGAITAQARTAVGGQKCVGLVSRTTTGDYRIALDRGWKRVLRASTDVTMPTAATAPTVAAGNDSFIQGITAAMYAGTAPITATGFAITTVRSDTDALADPTSGVTITWELEVSDI